MKAETQRLRDIFEPEGCLLVPVFQRPYVWRRDRNWQPLWDDILSMVSTFSADTDAEPHFLGAVVLDVSQKHAADISVRQVIDGQQRLTTLQVLFCSARDAFREAGADEKFIKALDRLTSNKDHLSDADFAEYKVWPTLRDRESFRAIVAGAENLRSSDTDSLLVDAYEFFFHAVIEWLDENQDSASAPAILVKVLRSGLQMVVIELTASDNAQVIFESLNDRGTPLLPSDLIKNSLFQQLERTGADVEQVFDDHWRRLESDYWQEEVRQGRLFRSRLDAFFAHYLTMHTGAEVPSGSLFTTFKNLTMAMSRAELESLCSDIATTADLYRRMLSDADGAPHARLSKTAEALDTTVVAPVLLYLERHADATDRRTAYDHIESWLVRRALIRSTSKNYNRILLDLLHTLKRTTANPASTVRDFLLNNTSESGKWPTDAQVRDVLIGSPLYKNLTRARVRLVLRGCDEGLRVLAGDSNPNAHLATDLVQLLTDPDELDEALIPTLGNCTLVKSPRPRTLAAQRRWADRRDLIADSTALNSELPVDVGTTEINERALRLADGFCTRWPHPHGEPIVARSNPTPADSDDDADRPSWQPIESFFETAPVGTVARLDTFVDATGEPLPQESISQIVSDPRPGFVVHMVAGKPFLEMTQRRAPAEVTRTERTTTASDASRPAPERTRQPLRTRITHDVSLLDLMKADLIRPGDRLQHHQLRLGRTHRGQLTTRGTITAGGEEYTSPSAALTTLTGQPRNGWKDWHLERTDQSLAMIREEYLRNR